MSITIKVKTSPVGDIYDITIEEVEVATILTVKQLVEEKSAIPTSAQRLIYKGRVLKDEMQVSSLGIADGQTVLLVKGRTGVAPSTGSTLESTNANDASPRGRPYTPADAPSLSTPVPAPTPAPAANPFAAMGGMGGMGSNPEAMQQMMQNPAMQAMMDQFAEGISQDPEMLFTMMPQLRAVCERNPEVLRLLSNPDTMRQAFRMSSNPSLMREMQQQQDQAMANISSMPGGYNALASAFSEMNDPLMDDAEGLEAGDHAGAHEAGEDAAEGQQQGQQRQANPMAAMMAAMMGGQQGSNAAAGDNAGADNTNPMAAMMAAMAANNGGAGAGAAGVQDPMGLLQNDAAMGMMEQLAQNPALMRSLMQMNPEAQSNPMMAAMMQNDDFVRSLPGMMRAMRGMGGAQPQQQQQQQNPFAFSPLGMGQGQQQGQQQQQPNPMAAMMAAMMGGNAAAPAPDAPAAASPASPASPTPAAAATPAAAPSTPDANNPFAFLSQPAASAAAAPAAGASSAAPPTDPFAAMMAAMAANSSGNAASTNAGGAAPNPMAAMMAAMMGGNNNNAAGANAGANGGANPFNQMMFNPFLFNQGNYNHGMSANQGAAAASPTSSMTPAQQREAALARYTAQLDSLESMGFPDRQSNLTALMQTGGNVEAAIDRILGGGSAW